MVGKETEEGDEQQKETREQQDEAVRSKVQRYGGGEDIGKNDFHTLLPFAVMLFDIDIVSIDPGGCTWTALSGTKIAHWTVDIVNFGTDPARSSSGAASTWPLLEQS